MVIQTSDLCYITPVLEKEGYGVAYVPYRR